VAVIALRALTQSSHVLRRDLEQPGDPGDGEQFVGVAAGEHRHPTSDLGPSGESAR
jgi:hypothetical protein